MFSSTRFPILDFQVYSKFKFYSFDLKINFILIAILLPLNFIGDIAQEIGEMVITSNRGPSLEIQF